MFHSYLTFFPSPQGGGGAVRGDAVRGRVRRAADGAGPARRRPPRQVPLLPVRGARHVAGA